MRKWIPVFRYKLIHNPFFSININIRPVKNVKNERILYDRCVCCGRRIVSNVIGSTLEWACTGDRKTPACTSIKQCPPPSPECPLVTDRKILQQRFLYHFVLQASILESLQMHGYCVMNQHPELKIVLKELWGNVRVYKTPTLFIIYPIQQKKVTELLNTIKAQLT